MAHSAQVMEIQDTDFEINELGGQPKKGHRGLQCWSCGGFDHLQRDCKTGHDDDDDQPDGPDQKVSHMHNTLVMESDETSSMMEEMYRQLALAQLRGRLYKTGYRRTKAAPREVQGGVTGQASAITTGHGVSTVAMGDTWATSTRYTSIENSIFEKTGKVSGNTKGSCPCTQAAAVTTSEYPYTTNPSNKHELNTG